ncbi:PAS domain-containing sensor histidine kinase [Sphingomonas bacterium]|uniref:PAS domain-containing sensor histidine kinase n=1 Tax=Sphingomonas bacterium TaxID=1895847 RepID=UPI00260909BE|nr:PAS domain-containing sensor histidine kinase [Sphingomonas bacterium]MDB5677007.1 histidine kinase [Sphingomonas bacterium]
MVGAALALAIVATCWVLYAGLRAKAAAGATAVDNDKLSSLLASGPALAMVVRADGRLELPDRLADWLGLVPPPRFLDDMVTPGAGLTSEDAAMLSAAVTAAQKAGEPFVLAIRSQGSARTLTARGQRAPREMGAPGGVIIWFFDATESQAQIGQLLGETAQLTDAFAALKGLIEAAPLPMWYRGPDLRLAMVNSAYVRAVEGQDARDVVARGVELIEGSGAGGPLASAVKARDSDRPATATLPATINGARRMLRVHDVPLPTPPGGVAGFAIDVDELEQARGGIKRFADAQRVMLDRLSAGVAQFAADKSLTFCNQPFQRMFAMRGEWLADRPEFDRVLERMRESNRLPEVRDFPGWKAERRDWFLAATGAIEESWTLPGGTHLRVVGHPLPDGGLLLIFEDRTEQVQLASARDTLLRVRTATFDNLFEALGVFAGDGRLQIWNDKFRQIWGFEEAFLATHPRIDALVEQGSNKLAQPSRAGVIAELVRSAAVGRTQRAGRVAFADGRHFEFAGVPLPDGNALFTMLDISDSRRAEQALRDRNEALEAADRVKTAFVANMSYELRTPLTSIQGFAEMMGEGYAGKLSKQADGYVDAILESVARLSALVDDVLDLTEGERKIERRDIDLESIAYTAAEAVAPAAKRKMIDFAIEVAPSTGSVKGDAKKLREMVEHLLRHAVAGVDEGGRVLLHTDGDPARARIVVSDDGAGMDQSAVDRAFDQFAEPTVHDEDRALGLGLPLAKQFAEAHGGTIQLLSEPGAGTLLTVELPR